MKKFKLVGSIIKEIENLPVANIEAETIDEAYEKYRIKYVKDKLTGDYKEFIRIVSQDEVDNAIADQILK